MSGPIAIVTGAARGIGSAIASRLIADGYTTILVDRDQAEADAIVHDVPGQAFFMQADIQDEKAVAALFEMVLQQFGAIDVLVNNAGIIRDNLIWKMPTVDFEHVIDINLKGTWLMCKYAATHMKEQQRGRIINIASRAWLGNAGQTNYSASKAGVIGLTRALALELGRYHITVNAVAPGLIDTPMTQRLTPEVRQKLIATQPIPMMGHPEDIAHAVAFLCQKQSCFITGQTLYVDGGKSIGAGV